MCNQGTVTCLEVPDSGHEQIDMERMWRLLMLWLCFGNVGPFTGYALAIEGTGSDDRGRGVAT